MNAERMDNAFCFYFCEHDIRVAEPSRENEKHHHREKKTEQRTNKTARLSAPKSGGMRQQRQITEDPPVEARVDIEVITDASSSSVEGLRGGFLTPVVRERRLHVVISAREGRSFVTRRFLSGFLVMRVG